MQFQSISLLLTTALAAPSVTFISPEVVALPRMPSEALARFNAKEVTLNNTTGSPIVADGINKRAISHLYFCQNAGFVQPCLNFELNTGSCYNLNGWNDLISSAGPDAGTTCCLWVDNGCSGRSICFANPGISNMKDVNFNDIASSLRCT